MANGNGERLETASGPTRRLLALVVGLLASLALVVSGAAPAPAQDAVGPQPVAMILTVGPHGTAAPDSVGVRGPPLRPIVSATGVAADTVPEYVNVASPGRTEHILNGDSTGGGHMWPGAAGKSPFPQDWSGAKIMHEASDIATEPGHSSFPEVVVAKCFQARVTESISESSWITTTTTSSPRTRPMCPGIPEMFDASYYEDLRGRARAVLIGVAGRIERDRASMLDELIDHNETGVAVEMMSAMLAEVRAPVTAEQADQIESLARDMGLDQEVSRQVRALVGPT